MWFNLIMITAVIVANVCWGWYWQKRKQRNGTTGDSLSQTSQTTGTERCTRIATGNNEGGVLTADGDNEAESSTKPADSEPQSSLNSLYIANIPTTQYVQKQAEATNNLGEKDKQNPETSESKEVNEEDIHRNEDTATDNTVGTSEYSTMNTTEADSNTSEYPISSNTTSDCPECTDTQNSSSNGSPSDSPADVSSTFPLVPEEDSSNDQGDLDNVFEINSANHIQEEVITGAQRISSIMNIRFGESDGLKVVILHSDGDSALALALSADLKAKRDFRVITQSEIEAELRMCSLAQRDVLDWADIIVPVVTDRWLSEINNVSVTDDVDSIQRLNTRYIHILVETRFVANASLNDRTVPVVKRETNDSYKTYPDLMNAILISAQPSQEEVIVIGERIVEKWKVRQCLQRILSSS